MKYEFINETENSATVSLQWEKLMIPFKVEVDYVNDTIGIFPERIKNGKRIYVGKLEPGRCMVCAT